MKKITALLLGFILFIPTFIGAQPTVEFAVLDIYVNSQSESLAAWQFELRDHNGRMTVVGVENGDHAAFKHPPAYDRNTVDRDQADRIVVASYSLNAKPRLPTGLTRVASVHVRLDGEPDFQLELVNAGNENGVAIPAVIQLERK